MTFQPLYRHPDNRGWCAPDKKGKRPTILCSTDGLTIFDDHDTIIQQWRWQEIDKASYVRANNQLPRPAIALYSKNGQYILLDKLNLFIPDTKSLVCEINRRLGNSILFDTSASQSIYPPPYNDSLTENKANSCGKPSPAIPPYAWYLDASTIAQANMIIMERCAFVYLFAMFSLFAWQRIPSYPVPAILFLALFVAVIIWLLRPCLALYHNILASKVPDILALANNDGLTIYRYDQQPFHITWENMRAICFVSRSGELSPPQHLRITDIAGEETRIVVEYFGWNVGRNIASFAQSVLAKNPIILAEKERARASTLARLIAWGNMLAPAAFVICLAHAEDSINVFRAFPFFGLLINVVVIFFLERFLAKRY